MKIKIGQAEFTLTIFDTSKGNVSFDVSIETKIAGAKAAFWLSFVERNTTPIMAKMEIGQREDKSHAEESVK